METQENAQITHSSKTLEGSVILEEISLSNKLGLPENSTHRSFDDNELDNLIARNLVKS